MAGLLVAASTSASDRERLLVHAETKDGEVVVSNDADRPFNPASVIKVGTSWWALDRLRPGHRFVTEFGYLGRFDRAAGRIHGDLVVTGGGDPDFHHENAILVARALNRIGVHRVDGDVVLNGPFWMGWENGAPQSEIQRARMMGGRLRASLDRRRWKSGQIEAWNGLCDRMGWDRGTSWSVEIRGAVRLTGSPESQPLITHRSNPLSIVLRRFNVYSNNDIVRIADGLGGVRGLQAFLATRLDVAGRGLTLATASGQGSNRMTARMVVEMLREFDKTINGLGLRMDDLLPIPGCDEGPTRRMFPQLVSGPLERTVVAKTGTLTTTDGGVVALAGSFLSRDRGEVYFCVGAPASGWDIQRWRGIEERWLLDLMAATGGAEHRSCGPELPYSDTLIEVTIEPGAMRD